MMMIPEMNKMLKEISEGLSIFRIENEYYME